MRPREETFLIVIIDDDGALREALDSLLQTAGFRTKSFASAEEFLRSSQRHQAACLVLDVWLAGMSGPDLQQHLAANGIDLPIVFITAHYDCDRRIGEEVLRAGAIAYLPKPFDDEELLDAVFSALRLPQQR
jgi:FixJ family two-component response regulator